MDIFKILETFYKDHEWAIANNDYETLQWGESNSIPKPTLEELEDKWNNDRSPINDTEIKQKRQVEILAVWPIEKQFEAITEFHMDRPEKMEDLLSHIQQVKDNNPKSS